jgi:hypothetical protein
VLDVALEVVDRLVQAVEQLEQRVGCVVDRGLDDLPRGCVGIDAGGDPVDRGERAARACLAHRENVRRRRDEVELEVLRPLLVRAGHRVREHREHAGPVRLEQRHRRVLVLPRLGEDRQRVRRHRDRHGPRDLVPRGIDQVGPLRRHVRPRLAPRSAGVVPGYETTRPADNAA